MDERQDNLELPQAAEGDCLDRSDGCSPSYTCALSPRPCPHLVALEQSILAKLNEIGDFHRHPEPLAIAKTRASNRYNPRHLFPKGLTEKQQLAYSSYMSLRNYSEVGKVLGKSRQAATKLVKAAVAKVEAISSRSVRARRALPTDGRGNLIVADHK